MKEKYAKGHVKSVEIDPDIYAEYISQRKYLEKSVGMLKKIFKKTVRFTSKTILEL